MGKDHLLILYITMAKFFLVFYFVPFPSQVHPTNQLKESQVTILTILATLNCHINFRFNNLLSIYHNADEDGCNGTVKHGWECYGMFN